MTVPERLFTLLIELPKIYNQDLLNNIFKHPYTKIDFVEQDVNVSRQTAARYLDELTRAGILTKKKYGKQNYYINAELYELLLNVGNHTNNFYAS